MHTYALWSLAWCLLPATVMAAPPATRNKTGLEDIATPVFSADHDITSLGVIFDKHEDLNKTIFFIESEVNDQGKRIDFGLYALRNGVKTKLLDNAKDIAVDNVETAYFAAKDGIYVYNKQTNMAEKFGLVNDDVISLEAENGTGALYYLNNQHQLYKVTENGRKSTIVDAVKNAREIVTDHSGYLVYHSTDKTFHVYDGNTTRKVEGIPDDSKKSWLVKAPIFVENYVLLYIDDRLYAIVTTNATAQGMDTDLEQERPQITALFVDAGLIDYFAKDKKIYELNIIEIVVKGVLDELGNKIKNKLQELRDAFNSVF